MGVSKGVNRLGVVVGIVLTFILLCWFALKVYEDPPAREDWSFALQVIAVSCSVVFIAAWCFVKFMGWAAYWVYSGFKEEKKGETPKIKDKNKDKDFRL